MKNSTNSGNKQQSGNRKHSTGQTSPAPQTAAGGGNKRVRPAAAALKALRDAGISFVKLGGIFGVGSSTAYRWVLDSQKEHPEVWSDTPGTTPTPDSISGAATVPGAAAQQPKTVPAESMANSQANGQGEPHVTKDSDGAADVTAAAEQPKSKAFDRPDEQTLAALYKQMAVNEIAALYNAKPSRVSHWVCDARRTRPDIWDSIPKNRRGQPKTKAMTSAAAAADVSSDAAVSESPVQENCPSGEAAANSVDSVDSSPIDEETRTEPAPAVVTEAAGEPDQAGKPAAEETAEGPAEQEAPAAAEELLLLDDDIDVSREKPDDTVLANLLRECPVSEIAEYYDVSAYLVIAWAVDLYARAAAGFATVSSSLLP